MEPYCKILREILLQVRLGALDDLDLEPVAKMPLDTPEQIALAWDELDRLDARSDYEEEFREGQVETNIPAPYSRYYSAMSVARKMSDGTWMGWTYWYGGGKHGEPRAVPWMEDAYELTCVEEEKVVTVRTFTKVTVIVGGGGK